MTREGELELETKLRLWVESVLVHILNKRVHTFNILF